MDRRRFVPSSEALEGRALLSTTSSSGNALGGLFGQSNPLKVPEGDLAPTFKLKAGRVNHLPYYLEQLQTGRYIPSDTMTAIQTDLYAMLGKIHESRPAVLNQFNLQLRSAIPHEDLTASTVVNLTNLFGDALTVAGTNPAVVQSLQTSMSKLAVVDARSPNPVFLVTNDYSIILETALAVGHPLATPAQPLLAKLDGLQLKNGGATSNHTPRIVGTYSPGAALDPGLQMQIVDSAGNVLGTGVVDGVPNTTDYGRWAVTLNPLPAGRYKIHARAYLPTEGIISYPSEGYILKIVNKPVHHKEEAQVLLPPRGPLGLK